MITTTKRIVGTACFSALAFVISFIEFPIFPAAGFLQLDFSSGVFLRLFFALPDIDRLHRMNRIDNILNGIFLQ